MFTFGKAGAMGINIRLYLPLLSKNKLIQTKSAANQFH
jgi:hypothetical protein